MNVKKDFEAWTFWWISAEHPRHNDGHKYEYYVNYCGIDRYLNRWVPFYFLKKDKELQQKEETLLAKKERDKEENSKSFPHFPNKIHHDTWTQEHIDGFYERTRMKTVEFIQYGAN